MNDRRPVAGAAALLPSRRTALALAMLLLGIASAGTATAQPPPDRKAGVATTSGTSPARSLAEYVGGAIQAKADRLLDHVQAAWPDPPEWAAMLIDILKGSQLGPGEGWFKKAVAQPRCDWGRVGRRLARDRDSRVERAEFPGADADFARLDRDRDGMLTGRDFDFSAHALTASPGMMVFYMADRDGNGKVTHEELEA